MYFAILIEHALIIWDKIKTLQVPRKQRKHQMREVNTKQHTKKNKQEKLINLNYFLFLL